jgi:hypothetical protein
MRTIKLIDCIMQSLLILAALVFALSSGRMDEELFTGYFVVGGWQVLSVLVHFFYKPTYNTRMRRIYLVTLGFVAFFCLFLFTEALIFILLGLLFFSPAMAVYYLVTCIRETQQLTPVVPVSNPPGSDELV